MACINAYGTNLQGERVAVGLTGEELVNEWRSANRPRWQRARKELAALQARATIEQRNDYAAALIHTGDAAAAIPILTKIEQEKPGLYATATNLGTAYELTGDNVRALQWIREGIRRNPRSHQGSEWLHVLILETKLKVAADPRWLETHSILAMGFGSATIPNKPSSFPRGNDGKQLDANATAVAIDAQMRERLPFVKPPDAIIGDILFDSANLMMRNGPIEEAEAIYKLAIQYGAPRAALAERRIRFIRSKRR